MAFYFYSLFARLCYRAVVLTLCKLLQRLNIFCPRKRHPCGPIWISVSSTSSWENHGTSDLGSFSYSSFWTRGEARLIHENSVFVFITPSEFWSIPISSLVSRNMPALQNRRMPGSDFLTLRLRRLTRVSRLNPGRYDEIDHLGFPISLGTLLRRLRGNSAFEKNVWSCLRMLPSGISSFIPVVRFVPLNHGIADPLSSSPTALAPKFATWLQVSPVVLSFLLNQGICDVLLSFCAFTSCKFAGPAPFPYGLESSENNLPCLRVLKISLGPLGFVVLATWDFVRDLLTVSLIFSCNDFLGALSGSWLGRSLVLSLLRLLVFEEKSTWRINVSKFLLSSTGFLLPISTVLSVSAFRDCESWALLDLWKLLSAFMFERVKEAVTVNCYRKGRGPLILWV